MSDKHFQWDDCQIVECETGFAYMWPNYYPPLAVGETVLVDSNHAHGQTWTTVTELGSAKGGAVGFVLSRVTS